MGIVTGKVGSAADARAGSPAVGRSTARRRHTDRRGFMGPLPLEVELQAELDLPGRAERAGDPTRGRGVDRARGCVEAGRVREVEALDAELHSLAEALEHREVQVLVAVFAQDVGSGVAVGEL